MTKMAPIEGKQTNWQGLWWHPEYNGFSSAVIDLADLRKFKGKVRLYVRKNKFFNGGENGRPNYHFCIKDAKSNTFAALEVEDDEDAEDDDDDGAHYDKDGNRLYTADEVRKVINGVVADVKYGYTDPYDLLISDYV